LLSKAITIKRIKILIIAFFELCMRKCFIHILFTSLLSPMEAIGVDKGSYISTTSEYNSKEHSIPDFEHSFEDII